MSHATLTQEIEDWLVAKALGDPDIVLMFEHLCKRLHAMGLPLERAVLNWLTLHPLFRSEHAFWRLGQPVELVQRYHATADNDEYRRSPFHFVQQHELDSLRRRLAGDGAVIDFDVLQDFAGQGFTDYLLTATRFRVADVAGGEAGTTGPTGLMASWATKRRGGFTDDDLDALQRIQRVLAVACRAAIQQRVMTNLASTYLGPTAGGRVLAGDIRRGDGDRVTAAVWFSDLRGSTRLSDTMDADSYLALLNRYFECTAQPVIDQGGEILNFIGDGVFAIFPVEDGDAGAAAARAEAAACAARRLCDEAATAAPEEPTLRFGIGLALGSLTFGNIGVPDRLAFSGIGHVVNQVHRVESATKRLGRRVLATRAFAAAAPGDWRPAGHVEGTEFSEPVEVYALPAGAAEQTAAE